MGEGFYFDGSLPEWWHPVPAARPSQARCIFAIEPREGDRFLVFFGPMNSMERFAMDSLRWFAAREGWTFYAHCDSADITTAIARPPKPIQNLALDA